MDSPFANRFRGGVGEPLRRSWRGGVHPRRAFVATGFKDFDLIDVELNVTPGAAFGDAFDFGTAFAF